ncbi:hypothetical protein JAAARDRAFT_187400 [Jaapia argillacea MUCL 33604]|uniref:Uncharacterized protein n=1 Tax=Jaapia argillacea MUCL 33604 TaxID=933084 RepID=A0A067QAP8_9AGAM|nr:hypothetical protein JAAARDRAFT_187400 [Jaapia argillacea MUCL 33604]
MLHYDPLNRPQQRCNKELHICLTRLHSLSSSPEETCSLAIHYSTHVSQFFDTLAIRLQHAVAAYVAAYPSGILPPEVARSWILGMRAELTLGNIVWREAVNANLVEKPIHPIFYHLFSYFFPDVRWGQLSTIQSDWKPLYEHITSFHLWCHLETNPFLDLPQWYEAPNLNAGVESFLNWVGLTERSVQWMEITSFPDLNRSSASYTFPFKKTLLGVDTGIDDLQSKPNPDHSCLDRVMEEVRQLIPLHLVPTPSDDKLKPLIPSGDSDLQRIGDVSRPHIFAHDQSLSWG